MLFPECTVEHLGIVEIETTTEYDPSSGMSINAACDELCSRATVEGRSWAMVFNGTRVVARPGDTPMQVMTRWYDGRLV